jgi:hypothetical protein
LECDQTTQSNRINWQDPPNASEIVLEFLFIIVNDWNVSSEEYQQLIETMKILIAENRLSKKYLCKQVMDISLYCINSGGRNFIS